MPRLLYIVTHPVTAWRLQEGQLSFLRNQGFDVYLISSPAKELDIVRVREGITTIAVPMNREIDLLSDLVSLIRLYREIRALRPDIVNAGTPKAGLLGMVASFFARVPVRIYVLRGLRLETKTGFARLVLKITERIASACATRIISVSPSLRRSYISLNLATENKISVLGSGSSNGIRLTDWAPEIHEWKRKKREELEIPTEAPVIGFVGRLTRDKGILELLDAFDVIVRKNSQTRLLIVGDFETGDPLPQSAVGRIREHPNIVFTGFVEDTMPFYHLMDVLVFPSYREGFPNAPLEAANARIPVVGFRSTGTVDAVLDGITGTLVQSGDTIALADAVWCYLDDPRLRRDHGEAARKRLEKDYRQETVWLNLYHEYLRLMNGSHAEKIAISHS